MHEADARGKSQANIFSSAIPFFVLIVIALVSALNSFRQATLILSVAVWCTGLAFLGLTLGQANFGFMGLVGAIGLAGLSINDSIVVLSHIKDTVDEQNKKKKFHAKLKNMLENRIIATRKKLQLY